MRTDIDAATERVMPLSPGLRKMHYFVGFAHPIVCILIGSTLLLALPFSGQADDLETIAVLGALGLFFLGYGGFTLRRQLQQDPTRPVATIDDLPPADFARQTRTAMSIIAGCTILLSAFAAYELAQLEFGFTHTATVWGPVALIYELFGFWPAVLFIPVAGSLVLMVLARRLRSVKETQTGRI